MYKSEGKSVSKEVTLAPLQDTSLPSEQVSPAVVGSDGGITNDEQAVVNSSQETQDTHLRADLVIREDSLKVVEVTVTNPCSGIDVECPVPVPLPQKMPAVEVRTAAKVAKYKSHKIIVDGDNSRTLHVFAFSIFGRLNKAGHDFIRKLSFKNGRRGHLAAQFREYWFQRLSCALQRGLASFYNFNLGVFRGDIGLGSNSGKIVSSYDYRDMGHIRSGSSLTWRDNRCDA